MTNKLAPQIFNKRENGKTWTWKAKDPTHVPTAKIAGARYCWRFGLGGNPRVRVRVVFLKFKKVNIEIEEERVRCGEGGLGFRVLQTSVHLMLHCCYPFMIYPIFLKKILFEFRFSSR